MMKTFRILALVATLALVFSFQSAQAQNQDTNTSDQYTTQSTDQTTTTTTPTTDENGITVQQNEDMVSTPDPYADMAPNQPGGELTNDRSSKFFDRQANRVQEITNDSGGN